MIKEDLTHPRTSWTVLGGLIGICTQKAAYTHGSLTEERFYIYSVADNEEIEHEGRRQGRRSDYRKRDVKIK